MYKLRASSSSSEVTSPLTPIFKINSFKNASIFSISSLLQESTFLQQVSSITSSTASITSSTTSSKSSFSSFKETSTKASLAPKPKKPLLGFSITLTSTSEMSADNSSNASLTASSTVFADFITLIFCSFLLITHFFIFVSSQS